MVKIKCENNLDIDNYLVLIYRAQCGIGSFCSLRNLSHGHKDGPGRVPASRLRQLQYKNGPAKFDRS
jgi:hypothetical protein